MITNYETSEGIKKAKELCISLSLGNLRSERVERALQLQRKIYDASDPQARRQRLKVELLDDLIPTTKFKKRPSALDNIVLRPNQEAFV